MLSSQWNYSLQKKRARKSSDKPAISSLISTSGATSSLGFKSFLRSLPSMPLFKQVKSSSDPSLATPRSDHTSPVKLWSSKSLKKIDRRAQSLYISSDNRTEVVATLESSSPSHHHNKKPPHKFSFDLKLPGRASNTVSDISSPSCDDQVTSSPTSKEGGNRQSVTGFRKRAVTIGNTDKPPLAPSISNNQTHVLDTSEEDDDFYISSAVRDKARERRLKESNKRENSESWDDDFDMEVDGLQVPTSVRNSQENLRVDIANLKKFALHIEDLKLLYDESTQIIQSISSENRAQIEKLNNTYAKVVLHALSLIEFAGSADIDKQAGAPTEEQRKLLSEILQIDPSNQNKPNQSCGNRRQHTPSSASLGLASLTVSWAQQSPAPIGTKEVTSIMESSNDNLRTVSSSWTTHSKISTPTSPVLQSLINTSSPPEGHSIISIIQNPLQPSKSDDTIPSSPKVARSRASSGWSTTSLSVPGTPRNIAPEIPPVNKFVIMDFGVDYMPKLLMILGEVTSKMTQYLAELRVAIEKPQPCSLTSNSQTSMRAITH